MVFEESRDYVVKFIANHKEPVSKQAVIDYMGSEKVPAQYRTSRVTTLNIIKELESGGRIKVLKGTRRGQSHRLIINDESQYKKISDDLLGLANTIKKNEIDRYKLLLKRKGGGKPIHLSGLDGIILSLLFSLIIINGTIRSDADLRRLYWKVIALMSQVAAKKIEELSIESP